MTVEYIAVMALTIGVVILNCIVAVRAIALAMDLETGRRWVCQTIGEHCVVRVLMGIATICLILALLKGWSIADIFIDYWDDMSHTYQIRAFAYLGENFGVAMLGYAVVSVFKSMTRCTTSVKYKRLKEKWNGIERRVAELEAR